MKRNTFVASFNLKRFIILLDKYKSITMTTPCSNVCVGQFKQSKSAVGREIIQI